jgi:hypothetical protein
LGIKRLGGCFGRFTGGTIRGFCGPFPAGGSLEPDGIRLELAPEGSADGFEGTTGGGAEG